MKHYLLVVVVTGVNEQIIYKLMRQDVFYVNKIVR